MLSPLPRRVCRSPMLNSRFIGSISLPRLGAGRGKFDDLARVIATLFSNDEPGFLFLASPETCFTDTAGTTPATVGDPVALWLDQSGNGNHATQPTSANRPILGRKPKGGVTANSIGSGFDITEPGKPDVYYLFFGGASDRRWMQTPVITPGVDKVQVFAGVRKLSDAARAVVVELPDNGFNAAVIEAPGAAGVSATGYIFTHAGDSALSGLSTSAPAPDTSVLSLISDLGAPELVGRRNGNQFGVQTSATGGGDYKAGNYRIGTRGGTDRFLNGEISALTTRFGPNLDADQIELVEKFTSTKVAEETIT